ncbi:MAG: SH3 domain-containing protein [Caldilineaceae bacterium]|nr:SH3 domain-containing protein [Caldilineaceae bacterium]
MPSVTIRPFFRLSKQLVVSLLIVVLVVACGGSDEPETPPTSEATPAAGGMVMPTAAAVETVTQPTEPAPAVPALAALLIGDTVTTGQEVRLRTDAAANAAIMHVYGVGEQFTILDPSGDYAIYPVEKDGQLWYRLRAADGLVGWSIADHLAPLP